MGKLKKEVPMIMKRILKRDRIRKTAGRFSFIPHRFLLEGFLASLNQNELSLYFFLVLASDRNGVSYYGQTSICAHLHLTDIDYKKAQDGLVIKDLLAFDGVFFQVLELPSNPVLLVHQSQEALHALCRKIGNGGVS